MTGGPGTEAGTARPSLAQRAGERFADYRAGRLEAMGELVELLTPMLWQVARSHGCAAHAAEDAVQEVWLRLVDHADDVRDPRAVLGWLVTAVKREAWRDGRAARRDNYDESGTVDPGETAEDPETLAILTERQRTLWAAVSDLPERCRVLLRLVAFVDRPDYDQVSTALGMPRGSIGPTRGRCLDKLRRSLAADPRWVDA
ncbi:RNA polymerase sigma factor (sigma-70 family) [Ornithinimicrobium humiphilum]|uniref:RNA polymerase sigma factor (Sigma-70 family) n=1 Tax=Ornithinimicrobium humiphilum TaxID=125288 RepID=A0A543KM56_9MICO|nr:sigma-70 family RNA polymerase sigma factor [Ornithinimicrobium humiphilum]TQM96169.1 RNA polymerase sigma factor (sigma-70 family) [Ornithinimicrobium humiphilum]